MDQRKHAVQAVPCERRTKAVELRSQWNTTDDGIEPPVELFEPDGPRRLKTNAAYKIRHILYCFPKLALSRFPEVYCCFYALFFDRTPELHEIPSTSTIRSNVVLLNNVDDYFIEHLYEKLAADLSPCGNVYHYGWHKARGQQTTCYDTHN